MFFFELKYRMLICIMCVIYEWINYCCKFNVCDICVDCIIFVNEGLRFCVVFFLIVCVNEVVFLCGGEK